MQPETPAVLTGIPWVDRMIAIIGIIVVFSSWLSHFIPPTSWFGKLLSYVAQNGGKLLIKKVDATPEQIVNPRDPPPPSMKRTPYSSGFISLNVGSSLAIALILVCALARCALIKTIETDADEVPACKGLSLGAIIDQDATVLAALWHAAVTLDVTGVISAFQTAKGDAVWQCEYGVSLLILQGKKPPVQAADALNAALMMNPATSDAEALQKALEYQSTGKVTPKPKAKPGAQLDHRGWMISQDGSAVVVLP